MHLSSHTHCLHIVCSIGLRCMLSPAPTSCHAQKPDEGRTCGEGHYTHPSSTYTSTKVREEREDPFLLCSTPLGILSIGERVSFRATAEAFYETQQGRRRGLLMRFLCYRTRTDFLATPSRARKTNQEKERPRQEEQKRKPHTRATMELADKHQASPPPGISRHHRASQTTRVAPQPEPPRSERKKSRNIHPLSLPTKRK